MVGISVSGMKSRVQRGRAQLRELFDQCCEIAVDARGKPADFMPRPKPCGCAAVANGDDRPPSYDRRATP